MIRISIALLLSVFITSCNTSSQRVDILIKNGAVVDGSGSPAFKADIAITGDIISFIGNSDTTHLNPTRTIDATDLIVSPGFIDPHTHSLGDLKSETNNSNLNYLTQGVTTVFNGNDGEGPYNIDQIEKELNSSGIGTNTAFLVGHGTVRKEVLGDENTPPTDEELLQMKALVKQGMETGAFGFSTGLYYAPGSFSTTDEIITLTKEIAPFNGIYDSHIRDESSYSIGLLGAVIETIRIGEESGVPVHFAHIKALGVDVWGKSNEVIQLIEAAQQRGMVITADQYPWIASGTHLENALISRWVMEGGEDAYYKRLNDSKLLPTIKKEMAENLRKRGGPSSILLTADYPDEEFIGLNLEQIATKLNVSPIDAALEIARNGGARIASFNMTEADLKNFMTQDWVMTSSDGTKGHPRKYASFPKKYDAYVIRDSILSLETFVYKCSGLVASTFGIKNRGYLKKGNYADILIFNPSNYKPKADFSNPAELSEGVQYLFVNGALVINNSEYNGTLNGVVLKKQQPQINGQ